MTALLPEHVRYTCCAGGAPALVTLHVDNEAGIALYRKPGFEIEGTHRRFAFRNGAYVDAYSMEYA